MKLLTLLTVLLLTASSVTAQNGYLGMRLNGSKMTNEWYVTGSPGNTIGNSRTVVDWRDSTYLRWYYATLRADFYSHGTRDDGYAMSFLGTDGSGNFTLMPATRLKDTFYTKALSDARYLQSFTETDPIWSAASVNYYTKTQSDGRYLQSFTELDPVFSASPSFGITNTNISNWNTAFGWGNHATAGYATASNSMTFTNKTGNISQWTNDAAYLTSITSGQVTTALGYTPYNSTNPSGYISSYTETDPLFNTKFAAKSTTDLAEGTNLYYTTARFNTAFSGKSTTDLTEGTNLYYTAARFNTAFSGKSTTDLAEGTNLYYTQTRFNTAFAAKTTDGLAEGSTNLYFTNARARAALSQGTGISYNSSTGVITNSAPDQTVVITDGTGISHSGTYPNFTITNTAPFSPAVDTLSASRAFNTTYLGSSTKYVEVKVSASITCTLSLSGGTAGTIFLETSPDASTWTAKGQLNASNTGTLTIGLNTSQVSGGQVSALVPPTYFWRARTSSGTGTATFTMLAGEKVTYN